MVLGHRQRLSRAVRLRGGHVRVALDSARNGGEARHERPCRIHFVRGDRLAERGAEVLTGHVQHELSAADCLLDGVRIAHVSDDELGPAPEGVCDVCPRACAQVVEDDDIGAGFDQMVDDVAADEAGSARDDDPLSRDPHQLVTIDGLS